MASQSFRHLKMTFGNIKGENKSGKNVDSIDTQSGYNNLIHPMVRNQY